MAGNRSDRSYSSSWSGSSRGESRAGSSDPHEHQNEHRYHDDNRKPRERAVYIKMRPAFGVDMDFSELLDAFKKKDDLTKETSKERFRPLHWAVEIGLWTIELSKNPSKPDQVCMKSTHVREWDSSWEKESSRMRVGTTLFSDRRLSRPKEILKDQTEPYHLFSSNCQNAAAKFAIAVCEDRPGAYDEIFLSPFRRTAFLDMREPLAYLADLEGWDHSNPEHMLRFIPVLLRRTTFEMTRDDQASLDTKDRSKNIYLKRMAMKYLDFERKLYASVTRKQVEDFQFDEDRYDDNILFAKSAYWYKTFFQKENDSEEK